MSCFVLTLNIGSSNLKFGVFRAEAEGPASEFRGQFPLGLPGYAPTVRREDGKTLTTPLPRVEIRSAADALPELIAWCEAELGAELDGVGHRIVHGGDLAAAELVTDGLVRNLRQLVPLAPLHQPGGLAGIDLIRRVRPDLPQVAAFDTAFHRGHDPMVDAFALPDTPGTAGLRRFGFHGLSYEHVAARLRQVAPDARRSVVAHLGSGASLCALFDGRSVDTTMGATPLDGLVMGTRCGAIDPGVVLYLQQARGFSVDEVADLLYRRSGLLGLSGLSGDMRVLLAREGRDARARAATDLFVFRVAREAAALAATLGGLDALVFTGGIGENAPEIRTRVCARLAWMGVELTQQRSEQGEHKLSSAGSSVEIWTIPTDEERVIARHTCEVLGFLSDGAGGPADEP